MTDGNYDTSYQLAGKRGVATITFTLGQEEKFNVLALQEDIRQGQRVEKFTAEVRNQAGEWEKIAEGTTVGFKRLLRFPAAQGKQIRVNILQARDVPCIAEIGLYHSEALY